MKPYIYSILFFIGISFSYAQTEEILLKETFQATKNSVLNLDLDNVNVVFEESFDDKIHFDYAMIFGNYSKKKRELIINQSKINTSQKGDLINLKVINSEFLGINYQYLPNFNKDYKSDSLLISLKDFIKKEIKKEHTYKTKDSILKEIILSEGSIVADFFKTNLMKHKNNEKLKNKKVIVKLFSIKVPKYVKIRIKSLQTDINFTFDITEPLVINNFKGFLKFKNILSYDNKISSNNGIFQAHSFRKGTINFRDMHKVLIGAISNTAFETETSNIQIGEIGENVKFNDFSSKLHLYNFNENFTKFNLKGDYTELNFYKVKDTNFSMDVFGHNTTLNMINVKTTFGVSDDKEMTKILEKRKKDDKPFLGNIEVALKNGVLNIN
ncbi:MAG: hypothetical protein WAO74_12415 [Polaribacter sp.]|uniref:hypothetical protein n=1 Tax=Polaribacter sp. TaxID=1920175 RepID=UPI003BAE972F